MKLPKGIREIKRQKFVPIHVVAGDTLTLVCCEYGKPDQKLVETVIDGTYTFDEGLIFEADAGVLGAGRALAGAFIEQHDEQKA